MSSHYSFIFGNPQFPNSKRITLQFTVSGLQIEDYLQNGVPIFVSNEESTIVTTSTNVFTGIPSDSGVLIRPILFVTEKFDDYTGDVTVTVEKFSKYRVTRRSHLPTSFLPLLKPKVEYNDASTQCDLLVPNTYVSKGTQTEELQEEDDSQEQIDYYVKPIMFPFSVSCLSSIPIINEGTIVHRDLLFKIRKTCSLIISKEIKKTNSKYLRFQDLNEILKESIIIHPAYHLSQIYQYFEHQCVFGECFINWIIKISSGSKFEVIDINNLIISFFGMLFHKYSKSHDSTELIELFRNVSTRLSSALSEPMLRHIANNPFTHNQEREYYKSFSNFTSSWTPATSNYNVYYSYSQHYPHLRQGYQQSF